MKEGCASARGRPDRLQHGGLVLSSQLPKVDQDSAVFEADEGLKARQVDGAGQPRPEPHEVCAKVTHYGVIDPRVNDREVHEVRIDRKVAHVNP